MAIRIVDYELPYETHDQYEVYLDDVCIHTLVTHTPHMVDQWIADVQNINRPNLHQLIVGLDVEWRPNSQPNQGDNPVAVLQLCVDRRCLIFQIIHAPFLPPSLASFLLNTSYKFVGVGIQSDVERLVDYYGLNVVNQVDLRFLAAERRDRPDYRRAGIKILARDLLGKEIEKPPRVTMSRWDLEWLSHAQPVIIDQEYCPWNQCNLKVPSKVRISNVSFKNITGTTPTREGVKLICSKGIPCKNVVIGNIDLKYIGPGGPAVGVAICKNLKPTILGKLFPYGCTA